MHARTATWILTISLVAAAPAVSSAQANRAQAESIIQRPRIERANGNTAVIAWSTNTGGSSVVHYGTDPNNLSQRAQSPYANDRDNNGETHRVTLRDLQPNTTYYYAVESGQGQGTGTTAMSRVQSFRTDASGSVYGNGDQGNAGYGDRDYRNDDRNGNPRGNDRNGYDRNNDRNGYDRDNDRSGYDRDNDRSGYDRNNDRNGYDRDNDRSAYGSDNGGSSADANPARQVGFQDGVNDGRADRQSGHSSRATEQQAFHNADHNYSPAYGSRDQYRSAYREAYVRGYERGYNGNGYQR